VAALPEEVAPRQVQALRAAAFRLVSNANLFDPAALAADPAQARDFFSGVEAILTELNDRLTQVYFSHSEPPAGAWRP
jgi:hypothetical protein